MTEIASVIKGLTTTPPEHQRHVVETYFLPNGAFDHPLCHVNRFYHPVTSRSLVLAIYRWYKFLSPVINIDIKSIGQFLMLAGCEPWPLEYTNGVAAFDETKGRLYVNCTQVFTFWFIPWHHIIVELVTVLDLEKHKPPNSIDEDTKKWYIAKQNDLYQLEEWVAFFPFILPGARYDGNFPIRFRYLINGPGELGR